jgi:cytochrome c oxidase subunit II
MLILIGVAAAAVTTAIAIFVPWLPPAASEEREGIDLVFWVTTAICIGVFAVVAAVSIYAGVKFRVAPDDDSDGPPIHGHTGIEIVWTAVPAVLVTVIAVVSAVVLAQNDRTSGDVLRVKVTAQQFAWSFEYPTGGGVRSGNLYVPVGRSTKLELTSRDVIHSFWVPEFGQKQDAVQGIVTTLVITPTKAGEYRLICTELCGLGHSLMRSRAIAMEEADFQAWLRRQRGQAAPQPPSGEEPEGASLFTENCGSCHTLSEAGTSGTIGPSLDDLTLEEAAIEEQIRNGGGGMPPFEGQLSDEQIQALVQYLSGVGG